MTTNDAAVADLLRRGLAKITPEGAWTQRAMARTQHGYPTRPVETNAVCWCSIGALEVESGGDFGDIFDLAWAALDAEGLSTFMDWQDEPGRTHAEVLGAWGRALGAVERRLRDADVMRGVVEP